MEYFHQPNIDPVLFHLWGPLQIRWYSLLYVGGFLVGCMVLRRLSKEPRFGYTSEHIDQFTMWVLLGGVIGARIFYCVVYDPRALIQNPLFLFQIYRGGLSFHGGFIGTMVAGILFCRKNNIKIWNFLDAMCIAAPLGLAMGRMGNFINGELYGRVSYVPWAVIFRTGGPQPRHPSQLYELLLEGVILFTGLWLARKKLNKPGQISVAFILGYSACRFIVESFREPDAHLGYLALGLTMGQILSLVMASSGLALWAVLRPRWKKMAA